ncbi:MAG TPA: hypothetical protein PLK76_03685 [bacterium]|nr:hypothetical protein [bacterium]
MNKKFLLSLIILIILLVGVGFFYVIFKQTKINSNLTVFLPEQTMLYAEYNWQDQNLLALEKENQSRFTGWQKIEQELKFFDVFPMELKKEIKNIGYAIVNKDNSKQEIWLLEVNNVKRASLLLPKSFSSSILNGSVLAVSKQKDTLNLIQSPSYANPNQNMINVLSKFSGGNFLNVYLGTAFLQALPVENNFLFFKNLDLDKPMFLGLSAKEQQIFFKIEAGPKEQKNNNLKIADGFKPLNLDQNLFLIIKSTGNQDFIDNLLAGQFPKAIADQEVFKDLFQWPIMFFTTNKTDSILTTDLFKLKMYNYGLALKIKDGKDSAEVVTIAEEIVKNILAFNYPQKKVTKLPDKTSMTELVADSSVFKFKKEGELEILNYDKINVALAIKDDYLVITNSSDLLKNILNNSLKDNSNKCLTDDVEEIIYLKTSQIKNSFLNAINSIWVATKTIDDGLVISGCLE